MRLYKLFTTIVTCLFILVSQQLIAQENSVPQGGLLLPPALKRNNNNAPPVAASDNTVEASHAQGEITAPSITAFEDWVHRCTDITLDGKSITQCELLQAQQNQQGEELLNVLILAFAEITEKEAQAKGEFMLTSVVPLDVFLPDGLRFFVDGRELFQVPFRNCNPNGCWSQVVVDAPALDILKKGNAGLVRFGVMTGQELEVQFSLKGFTAGLNALKQKS